MGFCNGVLSRLSVPSVGRNVKFRLILSRVVRLGVTNVLRKLYLKVLLRIAGGMSRLFVLSVGRKPLSRLNLFREDLFCVESVLRRNLEFV